jgi:ABC-type dipeptide/oligopeptide/nickel transport system permease component
MKVYVLRRLAQSALTLLGVSVLVFVILRVLPGSQRLVTRAASVPRPAEVVGRE